MPTHLPFHPFHARLYIQRKTRQIQLVFYPSTHASIRSIPTTNNLDSDNFNLDIAVLVVALAILVEAAKLAQQRDLLGVLAAVHGQDEREDLVRLPVPIELLVEAVGEGVEIDAAVVVLEQVVALSKDVA